MVISSSFSVRKKRFFRIKMPVSILIAFFFFNQVAIGEGNISNSVMKRYLETTADRFYDTKEIAGNLGLALEYYKKAMKYQTVKPGVEWKITRCYWVLAGRSTNEQELQHYYREGTRYGKMAVKNDKFNSNAHLWYSLIVGSGAMRQGVVRTLYNRETIKSGLETAIRLNPGNSNAHVGLAGWYYHVPAIFGGDKQKAFQLLDRAINLEPDYTASWLVKAEFLIQGKDYSGAVRTLNQLLKIEKPAIRSDGVEDKRKAGKLLETIKSVKFSG